MIGSGSQRSASQDALAILCTLAVAATLIVVPLARPQPVAAAPAAPVRCTPEQVSFPGNCLLGDDSLVSLAVSGEAAVGSILTVDVTSSVRGCFGLTQLERQTESCADSIRWELFPGSSFRYLSGGDSLILGHPLDGYYTGDGTCVSEIGRWGGTSTCNIEVRNPLDRPLADLWSAVRVRVTYSEPNPEAGFGYSYRSFWAEVAVLFPPTEVPPDDEPPVATIAPPTPTGPGSFVFDGTDSEDPDGGPLSHEWDFGDGTTASGANANHTYDQPGTYVVELTVADDEFDTDTDTVVVEVAPPTLGLRVSFPGIDPALFEVDDEVPVRVHVSASGDGVGPLTVTLPDPLVDVTPDAALVAMSGPTPPVPTPLELEPGESTSFDLVYTAVVPGAFTVASAATAVDAIGRDVVPAGQERNGRIGELDVVVTLDPEQVELEESGDGSGPVPEDVTVTIDVTNPLDAPIENLVLSIREPQLLVERVPPLGYTAFSYLVPPPEGELGPPAPGDPADVTVAGPIAPGETVTRELSGLAMRGGDVALAVNASAQVVTEGDGVGPTVRGGGDNVLEILADVLLEFDAAIDPGSHYLIGGEPWVDGGATWRIGGTFENRTPDKDIQVTILPLREGNATDGVPIPEFTAPPAPECRTGMTHLIPPGEEVDFEAMVPTLLDGGTRGTISYVPEAAVVEEDGTLSPIDASRILVTPGSDEHTTKVDVRDRAPIPPTAAVFAWIYVRETVEAFVEMVGSLGLLGIQATAFALQPWNWEAAYRAAGDKTAEYILTVYENLSPADRQLWLDDWTAALALATGMALVDARAAVDAAVASSFTELTTAWETGDSATVAEWWGRQTGSAPDLALGAATRFLGVCRLIARATPWARSAVVAREAAIAQEVAALGPALTAKNFPTGGLISRAQRRGIWGIDDAMNRVVQEFSDATGIALGVRRRGPGALDKIEAGTHHPKVFHVKAKNSGRVDVNRLGFVDDIDTVAIKQPPPLSEVSAALAGAGPDEVAQTLARLEQRVKEWYGPGPASDVDPAGWRAWLEDGTGADFSRSERARWAREINAGGMRVPRQGAPLDYRTNVRNGRSLPPDDVLYDRVPTRIRAVDGTDGRPQLIIELNYGDGFRPLTGDMDLMVLTSADFRLLSEAERIKFYEKAYDLGFEHVESSSWNDPAGRNGYLRDHSIDNPDAEALFTWMPNNTPRATRFDPRHSWFRPGDAAKAEGTIYLRGANVYVKSTDGDADVAVRAEVAEGVDGLVSPRTIFFTDPACQAPEPGSELGSACSATFDRGDDALVLRQTLDGDLEAFGDGGWSPTAIAQPGQVPIRPTTVVTEPGDEGADRLEIASMETMGGATGLEDWFGVGDLVVIDPGGPNEEYAFIGGFGSLVFTEPLTSAHAPGEMIALVEPAVLAPPPTDGGPATTTPPDGTVPSATTPPDDQAVPSNTTPPDDSTGPAPTITAAAPAVTEDHAVRDPATDAAPVRSLPRTGSDPARLAGVGLCLVLLGLAPVGRRAHPRRGRTQVPHRS